jgi:hypothetical protein
MCATWHPKDDLIASASLDQTVRYAASKSLMAGLLIPGSGIVQVSERNTLLHKIPSPHLKNKCSNVASNTTTPGSVRTP